MAAMQRPWTNRELLVMLVVAWLAGAGLLLVAWRSDTEDERLHSAPQCTQEQQFTRARCLAELDGSLTALTSDYAQLDVAGRHVTMETTIHRDVPSAGGRPVRVTFYRGEPVRVEADHLRVESNDQPADDRMIFTIFGGFLLVAGTGSVLAALAQRRTA